MRPSHGSGERDREDPCPLRRQRLGNPAAAERCEANSFSITRQLRYSSLETQRALDLCLVINGLPVATFEFKDSLTKQTVADAAAWSTPPC